jgi:amino acid transporter
MSNRPETSVPGGAVRDPARAARLEPDAIGVTQDTIIGLANVGPALTVGLTLAGLAAAAAYGGATTILICLAPMLVIANAYRRLNLWNANCGASFEWVGRAINPYLGFFTGWLMIAANLLGNIAATVVLAPSLLAVFGDNASSKWPNILIATAIIVIMTVIAIVGIRPTARVQVGMAAVEYAILIGFAIVGLVAVLGHHRGTYPITKSWFGVSGIGGHGSLASGLLIAVFMFAGWDATVYVNEEVKHRRVNPGRAAIFAVGILAIIYILSQVGLQGVVSPSRLQGNSSSVLVYVAQALGGSGWAKVMALALALSVAASVGIGIVSLSRISYGMATHRVLPVILGSVNRRFATPMIASIVMGVSIIVLTWIYLLSGSIANLFTQLISVDGLLYAAFYVLTALAAIAYYWHRIFTSAWDALFVGLLPVGAIAFLVWIGVRSMQTGTLQERWSLIGITVAGVLLMLAARFILRSSFFQTPRESAPPLEARPDR